MKKVLLTESEYNKVCLALGCNGVINESKISMEKALEKANEFNEKVKNTEGWEFEDNDLKLIAKYIMQGAKPSMDAGDLIFIVKAGKDKCHCWVECDDCGLTFRIDGVNDTDMNKVRNRVGLVQDIIPFVEPKWRELISRGTCPCCYNEKLGLFDN